MENRVPQNAITGIARRKILEVAVDHCLPEGYHPFVIPD